MSAAPQRGADSLLVIVVLGGLIVLIFVTSALCWDGSEHATSPRPTAPSQANTTAPDPCNSGPESAYLDRLRRHSASLPKTSNEVASLFDQLARDPALVFDGAWVHRFTDALTDFNITANGFEGLEAPGSLRSVDSYAKEAATELQHATRLYAKGVDNVDPNLIVAAHVHMERATSNLDGISREIRRLCGS